MPAIQRIITDRYAGRDLPITLVLPDGARVPLSPAPAIDVVARNWKGLRALSKPGLGTLARAYVHGDVDFTGSARGILDVAESLVGTVDHGADGKCAHPSTLGHRDRRRPTTIADRCRSRTWMGPSARW